MRFKGYTFFSAFYLFFCLVYTKLFYRSARLIRLPFRGRRFSKIVGMKRLTTGVDCRFDVFKQAELKIGYSVQVNDNVHVACADSIIIGDHTLIASKVYITDHDHDFRDGNSPPIEWPLLSKPVMIGNNCWLGENVAVLKGVTLGNGCIVGANSVVTKSFPENTIIAGNPAKIIRYRP